MLMRRSAMELELKALEIAGRHWIALLRVVGRRSEMTKTETAGLWVYVRNVSPSELMG
jgi:hypothetical protein